MSNSEEKNLEEGGRDSAKMPTAAACRARHYAIAESIICIVENALEDGLEPYRYVETLKDGTSTVLDCSTLGALNEVRLGRIVKLLADLFDIQRTALGIPCVKEKNDNLNAHKKLAQELHLADRKFELDLMRMEREYAVQETQHADKDFLRALGAVVSEDEEVGALYEELDG